MNAESSTSEDHAPIGLLARYHGTSEKTGRFKIEMNNEKFWGEGALYLIDGDSNAITEKHMLPALVAKTPAYQYDVNRELRVLCECRVTGCRHLFLGHLKANRPRGAPASIALQVDVPTCTSAPATATPLEMTNERTTPAGKRRPNRVARGRASISDDLIKVERMRAAGLDPDVKMPFLVAYLSRSRPSIYRDLKKGTFPPPTKRAGGVFWRLSVIEAYRLGQWVGENDLNPAAGNISRETALTPSNTRKPANDGAHGEKTDSAATPTAAGTDSQI